MKERKGMREERTHEFVLIWYFELFENDGNFPWIGTAGVTIKDNWLNHFE